MSESFFNKVVGVLWILRNFQEHLSYRTPTVAVSERSSITVTDPVNSWDNYLISKMVTNIFKSFSAEVGYYNDIRSNNLILKKKAPFE